MIRQALPSPELCTTRSSACFGETAQVKIIAISRRTLFPSTEMS
ncbi:hypothetical protein SAMN05216598_3908 [Pseudomonas asplenii]|uniref:Uncharacterized protein n=1 Tax=Pseudomonas asplenii TaxID=53407 RepID=A0A1H1XHL6_9PSED|nr:hypothetical protein SAMN05216598_3908 [Pseudomonas asplenii]